MLLERRREFAALEVLARQWHTPLSAYEIGGLSGVSPPRVYDALERLATLGLVLREDSKARIDFTQGYSWRFKILNDAGRLHRLPERVRRAIWDLYAVFRDHYGQNLLSAMVIGSAATGQMTAGSDIDMLFIVTERKEMDFRRKDLYRLGELNLVEKTREELEHEYFHGEVFILSALRDGIVLADADVLLPLFRKPLPQPGQESAMRRREHLVRVRERLMRELGSRDTARLVSLFRDYLIEMTRVELIERLEIPGTKADILGKMPKERRRSYKEVTEETVKGEVQRYV